MLVYNSGAIYWSSVANTPLKRFQLMQRVNPEGLYAVVQAALPHLSPAARVVVVSPPIYSRFFRGKTAYAMGKVGMSVLTKGLGMDFVREGKLAAGMAISSMWPAVVSFSPLPNAVPYIAGGIETTHGHWRLTFFAKLMTGHRVCGHPALWRLLARGAPRPAQGDHLQRRRARRAPRPRGQGQRRAVPRRGLFARLLRRRRFSKVRRRAGRPAAQDAARQAARLECCRAGRRREEDRPGQAQDIVSRLVVLCISNILYKNTTRSCILSRPRQKQKKLKQIEKSRICSLVLYSSCLFFLFSVHSSPSM